MRRAPVAVILALLLALVTSLAPAAAPLLPLPAALAPAVALAADDIEITTATRYTLDPAAGRVRVVVDVTAVNRKPNKVSGGKIISYLYDGVNLGVQPEARSFRATQDGAATRVETARKKGYRLVTVLFRGNINFGQTARVRLTFDLPGGEPRSASDVRVGNAFATFMAWAFGDRGSVRVEIPDGFRVEISGHAMKQGAGAGGIQAWTDSTAKPLDWYAWVNATNDDALTRDRLALAGGKEVVIRAWPEDRAWGTRVRTLLRDGVPALTDRIGLAWPVDGALTVSEVHTPLLEGYAGFYDSATDKITISEELDELTIIHEASHAWFNRTLFTERWITEGLADEYASRVLLALGRRQPGPDAVKRTARTAFPLADWPPPAPIKDDVSNAREQYGYDASWTVMRTILRSVGEEAMRGVFAAAAAGTTAYPGALPAERSRLPNDWRRLLDLSEGPGSRAGVAKVLSKWVLGEAAAKLLPAREAARRAYADLVEAGRGWAAPVVVRMAMDGWSYPGAMGAMAQATGILATRDEVAALAAAEGLDPPDDLEARYEGEDEGGGLLAVQADATAGLDALHAVADAADRADAPRDWVADLGLDGADPAAGVETARTAWEAGDLDATLAAAADAVALLAAAPERGRTKAIVYGGGATAVLLLVLLVVIVLARRRGATGRRARAAALASVAQVPFPGAESDPDEGWPYATLRPNGPPAEPAGGPSSGDEGADRS